MVIKKIKELHAHWLSSLQFGQLECWFWFQLVKAETRTRTGTWFIKTGSGFETAARIYFRGKYLELGFNWQLTADFRLDYWENWVWFQELECESKPEYIYIYLFILFLKLKF